MNQLAENMFSSGDFENAYKSFEAILQIAPNDTQTLYNIGLTVYNLKKYIVAIEYYYKILKSIPNFDQVWYNKGLALTKINRLREVIRCYDETIKYDPDFQDVWYAKGIALHSLNKFEEAVESYNAALKIDATSKQIWVNRGIDLRLLGRVKQAIESFNKALEIDPKFQPAELCKMSAQQSLNSAIFNKIEGEKDFFKKHFEKESMKYVDTYYYPHHKTVSKIIEMRKRFDESFDQTLLKMGVPSINLKNVKDGIYDWLRKIIDDLYYKKDSQDSK